MEEIFVTKLRINKVRHLENLEIPLSETERKHLILTGKNGSGKTSVLEGIKKNLISYEKDNLEEKNITELQNNFKEFQNEYEKILKSYNAKDVNPESKSGRKIRYLMEQSLKYTWPLELKRKLAELEEKIGKSLKKNGNFKFPKDSKDFLINLDPYLTQTFGKGAAHL